MSNFYGGKRRPSNPFSRVDQSQLSPKLTSSSRIERSLCFSLPSFHPSIYPTIHLYNITYSGFRSAPVQTTSGFFSLNKTEHEFLQWEKCRLHATEMEMCNLTSPAKTFTTCKENSLFKRLRDKKFRTVFFVHSVNNSHALVHRIGNRNKIFSFAIQLFAMDFSNFLPFPQYVVHDIRL